MQQQVVTCDYAQSKRAVSAVKPAAVKKTLKIVKSERRD
jgi:hypothetical protein